MQYTYLQSKSQSARRRNLLVAAVLAATSGISVSGAFAGTTNVTWTGGTGSWSNPADWTPNTVPQNSGPNLYNAAISTGDVTLDISPTIQQLNLSNGTLTGTSTTLTTSGLFTWSGGQLGSYGSSQTLIANGGISISNGVSFSGGTINDNGSATWSSGNITAYGNQIAGETTTFNNALSQTFTVECDQSYAGYGLEYTSTNNDVFNNLGTFTKSTTSGTTDIGVVFNSSGTVNVQTGTLSLDGGGTETGSFSLSSGAGLKLTSSTSFSTATSIAGAGSVTFAGGASTISGTYNPSGATTASGGSVTFNSSHVSISNGLNITGGTANFTTGDANIKPTSITLSNGDLTGTDTITTSGLLTWSGGQLGSYGSSQTLNANGGIGISNGVSFSGGTLNDNGSATWSSGNITAYGNQVAGETTTFNNALSQTFTVECDQSYAGYGLEYTSTNNDVFNNLGTFTKSTTSGTTDIGVVFNSSGTVNVQTGTLSLDGGGTETGSFSLSSGAGLKLTSSTSFSTASSIAGAGSVTFAGGASTVSGTYSPSGATNVSGGSVTFNSSHVSISNGLNITGGTATFTTGDANIKPTSITLSNGDLTGSDTITTSGLLTWSGGQLGSSSSSETLNANGGVSISNGVSFSGGTLNDNGSGTWSSGNITAYGNQTPGGTTTFNNALGETFTVECDQSYAGYGTQYVSTNNDVFNNLGTFTKSTTSGTTDIGVVFNSSGTVNVQTGTLSLDGGGNETGSFTLFSGAGLKLTSSTSFSSASSIVGDGNVTFTAGASTFSGTFNLSAATTVSGGSLTLNSSNSISRLAISGGEAILAQNSGPQTLQSLTITGGSLDITNNHMFINYGSGSDPIATIAQYLASGYAGGGWTGSGIISSTARNTTNGLAYGIGWADGKDHIVSGLSSGKIELKYTLLGDANLDGTVNGSDFSILAANFGLGHTNWDQGNFLYTSSVNGSDFSALAANFGQGDSGAAIAVSQADIDALDAFAVANGLPLPTISAVPEPASIGLITVVALTSLRRRRAATSRI